MMKTKNASMNLRRSAVCSLYAFHNDCTALEDRSTAFEVFGGAMGV